MDTIRKHYIVKRNLQLSMFFEYAIFMFFVAVMVAWTVYLGLYKAVIFELSSEKITLINKFITVRMALWFVPTVLSIIIFSVFLTHKIAGPIFTIQRAIKNMADNKNVEPIHLRKRDRLKDLAVDLNRLIDQHNKNVLC